MSTLFEELKASTEPIEMESMCTQCQENGKTRMLMTKIPFFKEVIVTSFECDACGNKNTEVTFGGKIADYGSKIEFLVDKEDSFKRDIVKSEFASIEIPEIGLEIPRGKGQINTLEGIIQNVIEDLEESQDDRRKVDSHVASQVDAFIMKVKKLLEGRAFPFHIILTDPSGNSYIKNPYLPKVDPLLKISHFSRTRDQLIDMGFNPENAMELSEEEKKKAEHDHAHDHDHEPVHEPGKHDVKTGLAEQLDKKNGHDHEGDKPVTLDMNKPLADDYKLDAFDFSVPCPACGAEGHNKMCTVSIPFFKELIIMAFSCDECGHHDSEVKTGGNVSKNARKITLKCDNEEDLKRDVFKSDSAQLEIPEVGLELTPGTLGGVYSTVQGLIQKITENLKENNPFGGDSDLDAKGKLEKFFADMKEIEDMKRPFTLIIDDPLDDSFIQNPHHPHPDPKLVSLEYPRTAEQNEELGLTHMKID